MSEREAAIAADWPALQQAAVDAAARAYAPYSRLYVGAAGLTDLGTVVTGCNVENASYGLGLCAECGLVSALHASGAHRLVAVSIVGAPAGQVPTHLTPCGRCRQLLLEAGGPGLAVDGPDGPRRLDTLLPEWFGPDDLP